MKEIIKQLDMLNELEFATHLTFDKDEFIHKHSFYEIFYITEGQINHEIDGKEEILDIGDAYILRPNDTHCFKRIGSCTHRDIMITNQLFKKVCDFLDKNLFTTLNISNSPYKFKLSIEQISILEDQLNHIKYLDVEALSNKSSIINSFLAHILGYVYLSDSVVVKNTNHPKWFITLLQKLEEPDFLKEGIPAVKKETNYNYIYLCRVFRKYENVTLTEYINKKRIELAKLYLTTTKLNISVISEEVGFNYPYRFNQLFKEYNGCTPIQYRKKYARPG